MAKILVVGGAGYVGSTTCVWLGDQGHEVWVVDDLSTGVFELIPQQCRRQNRFIFARAGDEQLISSLLQKEKFDCVMHFAAKSLVGESFLKIEEYYENNVTQTERLLKALISMIATQGIQRFIFSSSCAIFGDPGDNLIHENFSKNPLSPYGQMKLQIECTLENYARSNQLKSIALRYFNAAGAEPQLRVGEWHDPESHLIPRILHAAEKNLPIEIYGTDYSTPDGTCIRDYIHVWDLAAAHGAALERLLNHRTTHEGSFEAYNLGSNQGFSVKEVIQVCEEVTGKKLKTINQSRRSGDPVKLVADSILARKVLQFNYSSNKDKLLEIVTSAAEWEKKKIGILRKAIFLDRDGTLNEDPGYLSDPSQVKLLPHVGEALALLRAAGYLLVVVSNQSGVGRGLIKKESMPLIHQKLDELLRPWNVKIDRYELCFHHPDNQCDCRKPKPKLILDAAAALRIDLSQSYMIGDKLSDLEAGDAANCKSSILVKTGAGLSSIYGLNQRRIDFFGDSLLHATQWILGQENEVP